MKTLRRLLGRQRAIALPPGEVQGATKRAEDFRKRKAKPELRADSVGFRTRSLQPQELGSLEAVLWLRACYSPEFGNGIGDRLRYCGIERELQAWPLPWFMDCNNNVRHDRVGAQEAFFGTAMMPR